MNRRPKEEAIGLFESERQILDLHDAGNLPRVIARRLGKHVRYVDSVIKKFDGKGGDGWMGEARAATGKLAKAIQNYGGTR